MPIAAKIVAALQILKDKGWKAYAKLDLKGWAIYVEYIDEGPEFGYELPIDNIWYNPKLTPEDLAQHIIEESYYALRVMTETRPDMVDCWRS